jgi:hypothetical protein
MGTQGGATWPLGRDASMEADERAKNVLRGAVVGDPRRLGCAYLSVGSATPPPAPKLLLIRGLVITNG